MEIVGGAIIIIGVLILLYSDIMIIIKAFKTSRLWGFGNLFIPMVSLAFIVLYWDETKKYVLWLFIGLLLFLVGGSLYNLRFGK